MSPNPARSACLVPLLWLLPTIALAAEDAAPVRPAMKMPEGNARCLVCHEAPLFDVDGFRTSAHRKTECIDCHDGFADKAHEAQPPERDEALVALEETLGRSKVTRVPKAMIACIDCHEDAVPQWQASVHGAWTREPAAKDGKKPIAVTCLSCHGESHSMRAIPADKLAARRMASAACIACHTDPKLAEAGHHAGSYPDSLHGRLVKLGNEHAPGCVDCHGAHEIAKSDEKGSTVAGEAKLETCRKCHKEATPAFADAFSHKESSLEFQPIVMIVHKAFSWLTTLTLTGLFLHVLLDFGAQLRTLWRRRRNKGHVEHAIPKGSVLRFDLHQRIQHWLMLVSVILLAITGWPIRAAVLGPSAGLVAIFGGAEGAALMHRVAAVMMAVSAVYHLIYLTVMLARRGLVPRMIPTPQDVKDVFGNLAFLLGLKPEPPRFDKFSYAEKFDYWAVFWGVAIMGGTGLVRWFPAAFSAYVPGWALRAAEVAHGEEATLASLALFVWHFYNVHLRPSVFPMNWTWLTGRISLKVMHEEHGGEYERTYGKGAKVPDAPKVEAPKAEAPKVEAPKAEAPEEAPKAAPEKPEETP